MPEEMRIDGHGDLGARVRVRRRRTWPAPAGIVSRPGLSWVELKNFGKRTCKPNSVVCGHSSRRRVAADTHLRPTRRFRALHAAAFKSRGV